MLERLLRLEGIGWASKAVTGGDSTGDESDLDVRIAYELIENARADGVSLVGPNGLLRQVTKTVLEAALNAELDAHLGYEKGDSATKFGTNERNGSSQKTVRTDVGEPCRPDHAADLTGWSAQLARA